MKNFRKSRKALSPVVASIILIAVTVAVSIAVAAWMGALSVGFMQTEQMTITNAEFDALSGTITLQVRNTGTTDIVISSAVVNGFTTTAASDPNPVLKNDVAEVTVDAPTDAPILSGNTYQIRLLSAKGNYFPYNAVAP
jgi:flagellin-like protein